MAVVDKEQYLAELARRKKESHVYQKHQATGLALAEILEDRSHKALYIRLAKNYEEQFLLGLAKQVAENKNVKNRGAYFMRVLQEEKKNYPAKTMTRAKRKKRTTPKKSTKKQQTKLF